MTGWQLLHEEERNLKDRDHRLTAKARRAYQQRQALQSQRDTAQGSAESPQQRFRYRHLGSFARLSRKLTIGFLITLVWLILELIRTAISFRQVRST